jgi:hypothetical protein
MPRGCRYSTSIHHTQYTNAERMQTLKLIQKLVQQPLLANKKCPSRGTALLEGSSNSSRGTALLEGSSNNTCHAIHCSSSRGTALLEGSSNSSSSNISHLSPLMPYTALLSCHTHCTAVMPYTLHCSHALHCTALMPYTALLSHTSHCAAGRLRRNEIISGP